MLTLYASLRTLKGKKTEQLRRTGLIPAVLYGPEMKPINLQVNAKEFKKIYQEAGESSLIELSVERESKKTIVLISEVQRDPLSEEIIHVDFFAPRLTEKIEAKVPLVFEGSSPAVSELGGTLVKNIQELEIKALPQNLPREIVVSIETLRTFDDRIRIKDLPIENSSVEIVGHSQDDIVAQVVAPEKIEEELAKPIEEKPEEVERVQKPKKEKEEEGFVPEEKSS